MRLERMLLAGALAPLALWSPLALAESALRAAPADIILAQAECSEEQPCGPDGAPLPAEIAPVQELPPAQLPPQDAPQADGQPTREGVLDRARQLQEELRRRQEGATGADGLQAVPAETLPPVEAVPEPRPAPEPQPVQEIAPLPAPPENTTVEQQLEAQGDNEEANRVRNLRGRLLEQFQEVIGAPPAGQRGVGADGRGRAVERRGDRVIFDLGGGNIYVEPDVPDEGGRLLYGADDVEVQEMSGGITRTIVYRRNGVQVVTVRDRFGNIISRIRRMPDGREFELIGNRTDADGVVRPPIVNTVPRPRVAIPQDDYVVDLGRATRDDLRRALTAPPVQRLERRYTLDEVLRNESVRAYSPRIDLDTITFAFGSATIGVDQMPTLFALGQIMEEVLYQNPYEVYLIEGHTDAVGSDYDNLILSDRRAEAVAVALSQNFGIPPENLVTEGYGEQYLKVPTLAPERLNRRATIRRLTDLLQAQY